MAVADVTISESNGAGETVTPSINNINFGSVDQANLNPVANPITAQADGHSFEKYIRLRVSNMYDTTQLDNIKIWLSGLGGGWKAEEGISCNLTHLPHLYSQASYAQPIETNSSKAISPMPETEPPQANIGIAGSLNGIISSAPGFSDYAVLQMDVGATTPTGNVNQKTITFEYDEQ